MAQQDNDEEAEGFSQQAYVTPGRAIAFGGRNLVYRYSKPHFKNYTEVENELSKIDSYTRHRSAKRPKFNPYFLYSPRQLIQVDLCDKIDLKEFNDDVSYWLVCIDCFTRKIWLKSLKRKTDAEVIPAMKYILEKMQRNAPIKLCESDRGAEFTSRKWRGLMNSFGIKHRFANTVGLDNDMKLISRNLTHVFFSACRIRGTCPSNNSEDGRVLFNSK